MQTRRRKGNPYRLLPGGVVAITLNRGLVTLIDAADFERARRLTWHGHQVQKGWWYARAVLQGRTLIYLHHLVHGPGRIDHKNRDTLDNRRENLRFATYQQNAQNRGLRKGSATPFKGVQREGGRWKASITVDGERRHLGCFATAEEAARAYDVAAKKFHGEFALLNFPETVH